MSPEPQRIDVHAHYIAPAYREALQAAEMWLIGGIPVPEWTPELAIEFMDAHGIAKQVLSVSDPGVEFVEDARRAELARACNDYAASLRRERPDRFGALAVLPLSDPEAAVEEAVRALDELELDGIGLLSSSEGRYLGDPAFEQLIVELDQRGAWVFVHPTAIAAEQKPSIGIPDFIAEYPFDTTRTIISLLVNATFISYPQIRWHFAHGGGTIPMLRPRLTAAAGAAKEFGQALGLPAGASLLRSDSAVQMLERSFFDTALVADAPPLQALAAMTPTSQLVFGSDWPFAARLYAATGDPQPALSEVFSEEQRNLIERGNAGRELARAS